MGSASVLEDLLQRVKTLTPSERAAMADEVRARAPVWVPNPGPQERAYYSEADELFYGGQAGGGKTDLALGLALTQHTDSLVLRKFLSDSLSMADRMLDGILRTRVGWNGQAHTWRQPGKNSTIRRRIDFGGCQHEDEKQRYKGVPHDLLCFDEIPDFTEGMYRFISAWNRSTRPGQRCRVVATGNPPTTAEGLWVIRYWGPWLDPTHPNPAEEGELRWYVGGEGDRDIEVDGPGPHVVPGHPKPVYAKSRTFIRARLSDNPDLTQDTSYESVLDSLPEALRNAYRDGKFGEALRDGLDQAIPTAWVMAAQERWTENPPAGVPMCCIGVDVAQGGADNNVLQIRHDGWFAKPIVVPGKLTPLGTDVSGLIVAKRRDKCPVVVDCGGGYGGSVYAHLKENDIEVFAYKGAESATARTKDKQLPFYNKRTQVYWRLREALDPDQPGGSTIALPPDSEILSDLTAVTYEYSGSRGLKIIDKEKLVEKLGRSPDKGDAIAMAWSEGGKIESHYHTWQAGRNRTPSYKVINSYEAARRRR